MPKLTIWKFRINMAADHTALMMPKDAVILSIQDQPTGRSGDIRVVETNLWAMVDPTKTMVPRVIRVAGTGMPIDYNDDVELEYISTIQQADGQLVWHFFEVIHHG